MTMNPTALIDPDILLVFAAVSASFLLGCVLRLVRSLGQQRFEVAHAGADLRDLVDRCDQQQSRFKRIQEELQSLREELHASHELAAAEPVAAPAPAAPAQKADPLKLARAGADIDTLMARCKLSRAEAELVYSVHGGGAAHAA
jgi:hypothetical protein